MLSKSVTLSIRNDERIWSGNEPSTTGVQALNLINCHSDRWGSNPGSKVAIAYSICICICFYYYIKNYNITQKGQGRGISGLWFIQAITLRSRQSERQKHCYYNGCWCSLRPDITVIRQPFSLLTFCHFACLHHHYEGLMK
jgi:hypothetical protein